MNAFLITFIILYILTLFCYFFSETSGNLKRRVINKVTLAAMFFILSIVLYLKNYTFLSHHVLLLLAIFFAFLGDICLLYSFTKGGIVFLISNLIFFIYQFLLILIDKVIVLNIIWFVGPFIILFGTFFILTKKKILNFKNKNKAILTYIASVTFQGTLASALALYYANTKMILFGVGLLLFMISDYFLMVYKFKAHKNWLLRSNSACYFIGLLLVALSLMY